MAFQAPFPSGGSGGSGGTGPRGEVGEGVRSLYRVAADGVVRADAIPAYEGTLTVGDNITIGARGYRNDFGSLTGGYAVAGETQEAHWQTPVGHIMINGLFYIDGSGYLRCSLEVLPNAVALAGGSSPQADLLNAGMDVTRVRVTLDGEAIDLMPENFAPNPILGQFITFRSESRSDPFSVVGDTHDIRIEILIETAATAVPDDAVSGRNWHDLVEPLVPVGFTEVPSAVAGAGERLWSVSAPYRGNDRTGKWVLARLTGADGQVGSAGTGLDRLYRVASSGLSADAVPVWAADITLGAQAEEKGYRVGSFGLATDGLVTHNGFESNWVTRRGGVRVRTLYWDSEAGNANNGFIGLEVHVQDEALEQNVVVLLALHNAASTGRMRLWINDNSYDLVPDALQNANRLAAPSGRFFYFRTGTSIDISDPFGTAAVGDEVPVRLDIIRETTATAVAASASVGANWYEYLEALVPVGFTATPDIPVGEQRLWSATADERGGERTGPWLIAPLTGTAGISGTSAAVPVNIFTDDGPWAHVANLVNPLRNYTIAQLEAAVSGFEPPVTGTTVTTYGYADGRFAVPLNRQGANDFITIPQTIDGSSLYLRTENLFENESVIGAAGMVNSPVDLNRNPYLIIHYYQNDDGDYVRVANNYRYSVPGSAVSLTDTDHVIHLPNSAVSEINGVRAWRVQSRLGYAFAPENSDAFVDAPFIVVYSADAAPDTIYPAGDQYTGLEIPPAGAQSTAPSMQMQLGQQAPDGFVPANQAGVAPGLGAAAIPTADTTFSNIFLFADFDLQHRDNIAIVEIVGTTTQANSEAVLVYRRTDTSSYSHVDSTTAIGGGAAGAFRSSPFEISSAHTTTAGSTTVRLGLRAVSSAGFHADPIEVRYTLYRPAETASVTRSVVLQPQIHHVEGGVQVVSLLDTPIDLNLVHGLYFRLPRADSSSWTSLIPVDEIRTRPHDGSTTVAGQPGAVTTISEYTMHIYKTEHGAQLQWYAGTADNDHATRAAFNFLSTNGEGNPLLTGLFGIRSRVFGDFQIAAWHR